MNTHNQQTNKKNIIERWKHNHQQLSTIKRLWEAQEAAYGTCHNNYNYQHER
jgi:hypothetical protein